MKRTNSRWRWWAILAVFAMVVAACQTGGEEPTATTEAPAPTPTTEAPTTPTPTEPSAPEGFTYNTGIISDPTTDNVWAYLDTESDVYNSYVLASQGVSLYTLALPTYTHAPVAAAPVDAPKGEAAGDNWVFTFNTVKDLGLGGNFLDIWPIASEDDPATEENEFSLGLVSVEAPDDMTVVFTWNDQPGLATWQFGTAFAPAFPEHYWKDIVADAAEAGDLYAVPGLSSPTFGSDVTVEREPGAFVRNVVNENYSYKGAHYKVYANGAIEFSHPTLGSETWGGDPSGEVLVEYDEGPFISDMIFNVYGSQDAAALALINGDIDYWLNPLSLSRGLQSQFLAAEDLEVVANAGTGMFYMAFNTRRFPGNSLAFRQAADCMIDKEFVAENVLAGAVIPMDSTVAPGNAFWHNPDVKATCKGMTQEERLNRAVEILEADGWTWDQKPEFLGGRDDVQEGVGLTGPDGTKVPEIDLIAPGPGYDPMRATYSLWIQNFLNDLGIPVKAKPTGFTTIVDQVFGPTDWDMYILGWGLGTFPDYMGAFFHSAGDSAKGGFNTPGYSNPEFDELSDAFDAATDIEEARQLHFKMQEIIARDVPYVVLFTNVQFDVFRNTLEFPFTEFLQGITDGGAGLRSLVRKAQ
ncbi:MAG: ABC transporter substrate-binding protein [Acidimicrobiia bacterium]